MGIIYLWLRRFRTQIVASKVWWEDGKSWWLRIVGQEEEQTGWLIWTKQLKKFSIRVKFRTSMKVGQQDHRKCWTNWYYCQSHFITLIIMKNIWKLFILLTGVWYTAVRPFTKLSWSHYLCAHKPGRRVDLRLQWAVPALLEWVTLIIP